MKFFYNIMKTWTGRDLTVSPSSPIHAADVFIANSGSFPIPITAAPYTVLETRLQDMAAVGINGSAGAWVELGGAAVLANAIAKIQLSYTAGQPLEIGTGATAGSVTRRFIINQGEGPLNLDLQLTAGSQLWVRSLSTTGVTSGYITLNLIGL